MNLLIIINHLEGISVLLLILFFCSYWLDGHKLLIPVWFSSNFCWNLFQLYLLKHILCSSNCFFFCTNNFKGMSRYSEYVSCVLEMQGDSRAMGHSLKIGTRKGKEFLLWWSWIYGRFKAKDLHVSLSYTGGWDNVIKGLHITMEIELSGISANILVEWQSRHES